MADTNHEKRCPLAAVDRRLAQVHQHWHEAEQAYFNPDNFLVAIQTAIQTLRTVTFILQSNKRLFSNFDVWYDSWQDKLRADPLMRWMVDARNKIEKQGDLEMHSFVRAEIMASYYDDGPREDVLVCPGLSGRRGQGKSGGTTVGFVVRYDDEKASEKPFSAAEAIREVAAWQKKAST